MPCSVRRRRNVLPSSVPQGAATVLEVLTVEQQSGSCRAGPRVTFPKQGDVKCTSCPNHDCSMPAFLLQAGVSQLRAASVQEPELPSVISVPNTLLHFERGPPSDRHLLHCTSHTAGVHSSVVGSVLSAHGEHLLSSDSF